MTKVLVRAVLVLGVLLWFLYGVWRLGGLSSYSRAVAEDGAAVKQHDLAPRVSHER